MLPTSWFTHMNVSALLLPLLFCVCVCVLINDFNASVQEETSTCFTRCRHKSIPGCSRRVGVLGCGTMALTPWFWPAAVSRTNARNVGSEWRARPLLFSRGPPAPLPAPPTHCNHTAAAQQQQAHSHRSSPRAEEEWAHSCESRRWLQEIQSINADIQSIASSFTNAAACSYLFVCVFYSVNQIKYNTILFYIIYKRERLKRHRWKQKMLIKSYPKLKSK